MSRLYSGPDERLGLCRWNWKDPRGWEKDVYAWVRGRALRLWMMPVVLLCVFVAAEEWSESEMSRDMWPFIPWHVGSCAGPCQGATMWRFQTRMSLSNMTHSGCAINTTITVFDSLYPTKVLRKWVHVVNKLHSIAPGCSRNMVPIQGHFCNGSTHSNGSTRRCWCWKPFQKLLWPLRLCNLQVSIFLLFKWCRKYNHYFGWTWDNDNMFWGMNNLLALWNCNEIFPDFLLEIPNHIYQTCPWWSCGRVRPTSQIYLATQPMVAGGKAPIWVSGLTYTSNVPSC